MTAYIITAPLLAGCAVFGILAGKGKSRKTILLWSLAAAAWTVSAGAAVWSSRSAILKAYLRQPPLWTVLPQYAAPVIPKILLLHLVILLFLLGAVPFLIGFNCRRNTNARYAALLWSAGILLVWNNLLGMPLFYGIAGWLKLAGLRTSPVLPAFYAILLISAAAAVCWLLIDRKAKKYAWRRIPVFAGISAGFAVLLWLSAWGAGAWALRAMEAQAAELEIRPCRIAEADILPPDRQVLDAAIVAFWKDHPLYQPPFSSAESAVTPEARAYTLRFFDSPEMREYLKKMEKAVSRMPDKEVLDLPLVLLLRSLGRSYADRTALFVYAGKPEEAIRELQKYPKLDAMIPDDTPFRVCIFIRDAVRHMGTYVLTAYGPDDRRYLPFYREMLARSKDRRIRLPHEAGYFLTPPKLPENAVVGFFAAPYGNAARYRGFAEAVAQIPLLKKLEQGESFSGSTREVLTAKHQRRIIKLGRAALALKIHRVKHGRYPEKLAELAPALLSPEDVLPDPGDPWTYTLEDGHFTLAYDKREQITSKRPDWWEKEEKR